MNKFLQRSFTIALMIFCSVVMIMAQRTITGTITDAEDGEPLIGANILAKGTSDGTVTDFDGNYEFTVPEGVTEIEFSYVGYATQDLVLGASNVIDVALETGVALDEVVVIGYGTTTVRDATGAVTTLSSEDFNKGINTSPEQLIQGRTSGVQVTSSTGEPGASSSIRIRGAGSIRAGNGPLIVLDGVPLDGRDVSAGSDIGAGAQSARNPLNFINPNDIESVNILKDASAAAIYGARGANGVVIITTKKGTRGKPSLSFNSSVGFNSMPGDRKLDLLSADEFRAATTNPNADHGANVDAFDEITRNAISQDYGLSYGGSSESGRYRFSLSYQDQEGIVENTGLERYTGTMSVVQKFFDDKLTIDGKVIVSVINDESTALSRNVGAEGDLFISTLRWNPTRPLFEDGEYVQPSDNERNPVAFLDLYSDHGNTMRIFSNISASYKITDKLTYKYNVGLDRSSSQRDVALSRLFNANITNGGVGNIERINTSNTLQEHTLSLKTDLSSEVGIDAVVGYGFQVFNRDGSSARATNFLVDDQNLYTKNMNFGSSFNSADNKSFTDPKEKLQSFFGRVNLDLMDKFIVTATVRTDGSSKFGDGNKYGVFPSAAVAWKISNEDFMGEGFDDLKLRVGYGLTGNQEFPAGQTIDQFKPTDDGTGIRREVVGNSDLKWETASQFNVGVDFAVADYKLTGSLDYFTKSTEDLLFRLPVAQPGPDAFVWRNLDAVKVKNSGVELGLEYLIKQTADFSWDVGLNVSFYTNELENVTETFPDGIITGEINGQGLSGQRAQLLFDGEPLYAFYVGEFLGFNSEGIAQYSDLNGDGANTASGIVRPGLGDRAFFGDPNPDIVVGLRTGLEIGDLDISLYGYGNFGHQVFNNTALALFNQAALQGGANVTKDVLTSGQAIGDAPIPSSKFIEDADFFRIANLTVGYNLDMGSVEAVESLRLFVTASNLYVFTNYTGFDPEVNVDKSVDDVPSFGIDYSTYPRARGFVVGLNLKF